MELISRVLLLRCRDRCGRTAVQSLRGLPRGIVALVFVAAVGAWKSAKDGSSGHEFHVGPHLMVVGPNQDEFQGFNRDATNGMPNVTHLPNRTELFLVMPVRQWNE